MDHFRFNDISIIPQYAMSAINPTRKIGPMIAELVESRQRPFRELREELERRLDLVGLGTTCWIATRSSSRAG